MKLLNKSLLERFDSFVKSLSKKDNIALMHDTDADGTAAGALVIKALEKLKLKPKLVFYQQHHEHNIVANTVSLLKKRKINKLITVDKSIEQGPQNSVKAIEKFAEILVLDHHRILKNINSKRTLFLKPQLIYRCGHPEYYCTTKFAYDLFSRHADLSDYDWICSIGVIGDAAYRYWRKFIKDVFGKYGIKQKKDIFETDLGRLCSLVTYADSCNKPRKSLEAFSKSRNIKEAIKRLKEFDKVRKEVDYYVKNYGKYAEEFPEKGLLLINIKPKYNMKSPFINVLSYRFPRKTIIAIQTDKNMLTISARRQDRKIKVNDLLVKAVKGIKNAYAGGHIPAAGASLMKKDYKTFKKQLLDAL